jgi:predicted nucleotidyltransferase
MKKPEELPVKVRDYVGAVIQFAEARSPDTVSVAIFGGVAKGDFSPRVSDVDLIVVLADGIPRKIKRIVSNELAALELKHGLRDHRQTKREFVYSYFDRMAGQFKSHFVCYRGDLLSGNTAAVFDVNPLAESLLLSTHLGFANIVTSAKVVWGEDFLPKIHIPTLTKGHLAKNCASFLLLNACAVLGYPVLPNATKYSMSALKWMLHNCYFCYTLKSATVEEEIDFFRAKLGECKVFSELITLRQKYQSSFGFIKGCFRKLIQLYVVTVAENKFPITVKVK